MKHFLDFIHTRPVVLMMVYSIVVFFLTLYPFSFDQDNRIDFLPGGGVQFTKPATTYVDSIPGTLTQLEQFTLLINFRSTSVQPLVRGTIITNSKNPYDQNFFVRQYGSSLLFRSHTGQPMEYRSIFMEDVIVEKTNSWCAIVYDGETLSGFIDGVKKKEVRTGKIDCSRWDRSYPLIIGSEANGYWGWEGVLYAMAFYDEAFDFQSLQHPDSLIRSKKAILSFQFSNTIEHVVRSKGSDTNVVLNVPEKFVPFHRTFLVESMTMFWQRRIYFRDVLFNIVFFLPIGFLCAAFISRIELKRKYHYPLSIAVGFLLSLTIEWLQSYLPERISSISDLISNTSGSLIGCISYVFLKRKTEEHVVAKEEE